jgi:elongator complex protein 3
MFKELFKNPVFKPDLLKIYPCAVLKEAPLYRWYAQGKYKPYSQKTLTDAIKEIKQKIPYYVRIERVIRDIPLYKMMSGPTTNLRQIIKKNMKENNLKCRCIRCREIRKKYNPKEKVFLFRQDYAASGGKEIFLSFENKKRNKIYSLLKLRIPSHIFNKEKSVISALKDAAIIREVHTYGQAVAVAKNRKAPQHKGFGKKLVFNAEKIAKKEFKLNKIAVISGVGVRPYYRRLGYKLKNEYMVKKI